MERSFQEFAMLDFVSLCHTFNINECKNGVSSGIERFKYTRIIYTYSASDFWNPDFIIRRVLQWKCFGVYFKSIFVFLLHFNQPFFKWFPEPSFLEVIFYPYDLHLMFDKYVRSYTSSIWRGVNPTPALHSVIHHNLKAIDITFPCNE